MKKRFIIFIFTFLYFGNAFPQENSVLKVTQFSLDNGLTVYLNEDHSLSQILGALVVHAGAKNDPKNATGIAHYLEHVMFKGTDKMGTLNWEIEKPILDTITQMYDQLAQTQEVAQRKEIQKIINQLSLRAAEYAIPNEVDLILQHIGGTAINAFTGEEITAYFNKFPSNQLEKWMDVYVERFRNPVFRLFQSELETVYEEKNMYEDNFFMMFYETCMKNFYKVHPYGQQTIIGTTEHLKNPRLSKMMEFYNTYYVANNMALVLTGDFDTKQVIPQIKEKFAVLKSGAIPPYPIYEEQPLNGREEVNVKMSPIPIGALGFRTVPASHQDEIALEICAAMMSNTGSTGFLDQLSNNNKLWGAFLMNDVKIDYGGMYVIFIPKLLVQKLSSAETLVLELFNKIKSGDFSDGFFEGVKLNYLKEYLMDLEGAETRGLMIFDCFIQKKSWEEVLAVPDKVNQLTKEDIIRVANQYFGDNFMVVNSRMGSPKKDKISKPDWKPIESKNSDKKSEFAQWIKTLPETHLPPKFVDFTKDLIIDSLCKGVAYYQTLNPLNQIFSLDLRFKVGTTTNNRYKYVAAYLDEVGTLAKNANEFKAALQSLGADISFYCNNNNFRIHLSGFDDKMEETLQLLAEIMKAPQIDIEKIERLAENEKGNYKMILNDPATLGVALFEYIQYEQKSSYIDKLTIKEVKKLIPEDLIALFKEMLTYESEVHYVGTLSMANMQALLLKNIPFSAQPQKANFIETPVTEITKPTVYLHKNKKSLQSNIYLLNNGKVANEKDKAFLRAFNEYFGAGMSSIVFQEIRELRSLGYSSYAFYLNSELPQNKGFLKGFLGTQCDKTNEGVEALVNLVKNMPQKPERLETIKRSLTQSINTENVDFRSLSRQVSKWCFQGYTADPRKFQYKIFENLTFNDIVTIYQNFVQEAPIAITISGNFKKIDAKKLSAFGELIHVKLNEIVKQ